MFFAAAVFPLCAGMTAAVTHGDTPQGHVVKYVVSADRTVQTHIYYRNVDPPTWADYSHNPYAFSPRIDAEIGPGQPWTIEVVLADPNEWAMVATTAVDTSASPPQIRCLLSVDRTLVVSNDGPRGSLCSLRNW
jgi:hypothetical protein